MPKRKRRSKAGSRPQPVVAPPQPNHEKKELARNPKKPKPPKADHAATATARCDNSSIPGPWWCAPASQSLDATTNSNKDSLVDLLRHVAEHGQSRRQDYSNIDIGHDIVVLASRLRRCHDEATAAAKSSSSSSSKEHKKFCGRPLDPRLVEGTAELLLSWSLRQQLRRAKDINNNTTMASRPSAALAKNNVAEKARTKEASSEPAEAVNPSVEADDDDVVMAENATTTDAADGDFTKENRDNADDELILPLTWYAMKVSIETLLCQKYNKNEVLTKKLTLSVLHKLVPELGIQALTQMKPTVLDHGMQGQQNNNQPCVAAFEVYELILSNQLYAPASDIALKVILPRFMAWMNDKDVCKLEPPQQQRFWAVTLKWIQFLIPRGNPKTTFQLLVSTESMRLLARVQSELSPPDSGGNTATPDKARRRMDSLVHDILASGVFSANHHMEGILALQSHRYSEQQGKDKASKKSKKETSAFRTYTDLWKFWETGVGVPVNHKEDDAGTKTACQKDAIHLLPILYSAFLKESENLIRNARQEDTTSSPTVVTSTTSLSLWTKCRFLFFSDLVRPLQKLITSQGKETETGLDSQLVVASLRSIRKLTKLLLTNDVYVPSQDDRQQTQTGLLRRLAVDSCMAGNSPSCMSAEVFGIQENLLQLNHHVFQTDKLVAVLALALRKFEPKTEARATSFVTEALQVHTRLRQQRIILERMLQAVSQALNEQGNESYSIVISRLERISPIFSATVEQSPVSEISGIFQVLEVWISSEILGKIDTLYDEKPEMFETFASVAWHVTMWICQSIRVDNSNAARVSELSFGFLANVVDPLLSNTNCKAIKQSIHTHLAAKLCVWLIQLQGRSAFWIGRGNQLVLPRPVRDMLTTAITSSKEPHETRLGLPILDQLHLAIHRANQLVSLIHDEQLLSLHLSEGESNRIQTLETEARQLARFVASHFGSECTDVELIETSWMLVSRNLHSWSPHAESSDIENFLTRMFCILSRSKRQNGQEFQAATALMNDCCFLEIERIAMNLPLAGVSILCKWLVSGSLGGESRAESSTSLTNDLASLTSVESSSRLSITEICSCYDDLCQKSSESQSHHLAGADWNAATTALSIVNGLPQKVLMQCNLKAMQRATLALDFASGVIIQNVQELQAGFVRFLAALRLALDRAASFTFDQLEFGDMTIKRTLIDHIITSTQLVARRHTSNYHGAEYENLYDATGAVLSTLISSVLIDFGADSDGDLSKKIDAFVDFLISKHPTVPEDLENAEDLTVNAKLARGILCGLTSSESACAAMAIQTNPDKLLRLAKISLELHNSLVKNQCAVGFEAPLLLGSLAKYSTFWGINEESHMDQLQTSFLKIIDQIDQSHSKVESPFFFGAACFLECKIGLPRKDFIFGEVTKVDDQNELAEAVFQKLILTLDESEMQKKVAQLCIEVSSEAIRDSKRCRLMRLAVESSIASEPLCSSIRAASYNVMHLGLRVFFRSTNHNSEWEVCIEESSNLLLALMRNRDLLEIREVELGLFLSHCSTVLTSSEMFSMRIFESCNRLFLFLLQRFSKQLLISPALVVSVLRSFLQVGMTGPSSGPDLDVVANDIARLFESLASHGEVYKKHVVGLIVDFVRHSHDLPATVKQALLPSIFFLLDTLTFHEEKQLNLYMDGKSLAAFRQIHQTYKKVHAYKGQ